MNSFFNLDIESDDYDTIGGWIYSQIEIPPKRGQGVFYKDTHKFVIEETDHLRISRITVRIIRDNENSEGLLTAEKTG